MTGGTHSASGVSAARGVEANRDIGDAGAVRRKSGRTAGARADLASARPSPLFLSPGHYREKWLVAGRGVIEMALSQSGEVKAGA